MRLYFNIIFYYIDIVGDQCCRLSVKLDLLEDKRVNVTRTSGWLRGWAPISTFRKLKRFPGGPRLGLAMILTAIVSRLSDWGVSGLVKTAAVWTYCDFGEGLIINPDGAMNYPDNMGAAYFWATTGQLTSGNNGGDLAIYTKVNNATNFRAADDDILGYWLCTLTDDDLQYYSADWTDIDIVEDLVQQGYLYDAVVAFDHWSEDDGNAPTGIQLVAWSASSRGLDDAAAFAVNAAIDFGQPTTTVEEPTKNMYIYNCTVNGADERGLQIIESILAVINATEVLPGWVHGLQGNIYRGPDSTANPLAADIISIMLNSMVMVSGSGESIARTPSTYMQQGCLVEGVSIPAPVIALFLAATSFSVLVSFTCLILYIRVRMARKAHDLKCNGRPSSREICDKTPSGMIGWMRHAIHVSGHMVDVSPKDVKDWAISAGALGHQLEIVRAAGHVPAINPTELDHMIQHGG